jgi:hypothetical protein
VSLLRSATEERRRRGKKQTSDDSLLYPLKYQWYVASVSAGVSERP